MVTEMSDNEGGILKLVWFHWCVLLSVHHVVLVSLDVLVQCCVFGDPPHPRQDEAVSEGVSAQRAPPLCGEDAVNELKTETEAVMVILVEPVPGRVPHGSIREPVQVLVPLSQQVEHIGSDQRHTDAAFPTTLISMDSTTCVVIHNSCSVGDAGVQV